ncbi:hypothetical protein [Asticcacaulis sp. AND118]|uniref:hypothetical protein n=1 Tax=Asticcacaulis sp. AND118 TaxID=2840468 RepID=UPI001CFFC421|nr:hypothetical protein [Asticcacaulis sp. AND118]UDF05044.1 hypothetical protein LH365_16765 [Asticcacaulis sp. AND118]
MSKIGLRLETIGTFVALLVLLQYSNSGAIRYYLVSVGASALYNLPDLLAVLMVFIAIFMGIFTRTTQFDKRACFAFAGLLLMGVAIGYINTRSVVSVTVAFKMVSIFLFGYFYSNSVRNLSKYWIILLIAYGAQAAAIYFDQFMEFPWKNFSFEVMGQARVASKQWWAGGQERIAGLSFENTATAFAMLGMHHLIFNRPGSNRLINLLMYGVTIYAIYLTTSKTALICAVVLAAKDFIILFMRKPVQLAVTKYGANVLLALVIIIPLVSVTLITSAPDIAYLNSWYDRATRTWLAPLELMWNISPISFLTGMGLGMVDYPIGYSAMRDSFISYDNFLLGTAMMFGVPFAMLVYWQMISKIRILPDRDKFFFACLCLYGIFVGCYGAPLFAILAGSFYGYRRLQEKAPSTPELANSAPLRQRPQLPLRPRPPLEPRRPQG